MALTTCPDCGNQMSTEARACPKCGRSAPPRTSITRIILMLILVLVALFVARLWQKGFFGSW